MSTVVRNSIKNETKKLSAQKSMEIMWRLQEIDNMNEKMIDSKTLSMESMQMIKTYILRYMPMVKLVKREQFVKSVMKRAVEIVELITSKVNENEFSFDDTYSFDTFQRDMDILEDAMIEGIGLYSLQVTQLKEDLLEGLISEDYIDKTLSIYQRKSENVVNFFKVSFEVKMLLGNY